MGVIQWRGDAEAVAQVDTVQITAMDGTPANTTYTLTVGSKTVSAIGDTDANTTATALAQAWNDSEEPEFTGATAVAVTDTITLTADTPGIPFVATSSVTGGTGTIGSVTVVTKSAGPYHLDTAANWVGGVLPGDEDDVVFAGTSVSVLYGIGTNDTRYWASQPAWNSVTAKASFTGHIGLPGYAASGRYEYRDDFLEVKLHSTGDEYIEIGEGEGTGSGQIKLRLDDMTSNVRIDVYSTGTRSLAALPALQLLTGTQSADTTLNVNKGDVGVAIGEDHSAVIDVLKIGFVTSPTSDSAVILGDSVSPLTTVTQTAGTLTTSASMVTHTLTAGTLVMAGSATVTTLNVRGGTCYYDSDGTATTIIVTSGAVLDFRRDQRDVTVTQLNLYEGATVYDTAARVTLTNGIDLVQCSLGDVTLNFGDHLTWTPSSI